MRKILLTFIVCVVSVMGFQSWAAGDKDYLAYLDAQIDTTRPLKLSRTYLISERLFIARKSDKSQVSQYGSPAMLKTDVGIVVGVQTPRTVEYHFVPGKVYELYVFADAAVVRSLSMGLEKKTGNDRWQELPMPGSNCDMAGNQAVCLQRALAVREEGDYRIRVGVNEYQPRMKAAHYGVMILERKDNEFMPSASQFSIYKRGKEFTAVLEDAELNQEIVLTDIDLLENDSDGRFIERPMSSQFNYGVIVFADTTVTNKLKVTLQRKDKDAKGRTVWSTEQVVNVADAENQNGLWIFALDPKKETNYRIAYTTEGKQPDEPRYVGVIVYHENRKANKAEMNAAKKIAAKQRH